MTHTEFQNHIRIYLTLNNDNTLFFKLLQIHKREFSIMANLNLDPVIDILNELYCPVKRNKPRDPVCMLRSMLLMCLLKISGITEWAYKARNISPFAIFSGFKPGDTPSVGTYYNFMGRIINGPYQKPCLHVVRRKWLNAGFQKRNLKEGKDAGKDPFVPYNSQSEILVNDLLCKSENARVKDFSRILEDMLFKIGISPSVEEGLITDLDALIVSGDGSIMESASSAHGKVACTCRSEGIYNCKHDRYYTSPTAKWCYDASKDRFIFGDRYYHLTTHQSGHDFPLLTIMPGGNESDYTLSLKAFDRFQKACKENHLPIHVSTFCGDGHHDSYAHYDYFRKMNITPIIPLSDNSKRVFPHLTDSNLKLDTDGTPVCPGGKRMRYLMYNKPKRKHIYCCPAKRSTHRDGKFIYVMHIEECPLKKDCAPDSTLKPIVYIKSSADPRLYPPIPRDSKRFKELMNHRTSTERCNALNDTYHLDRSCRNADYGLIRLTFVNIVEHAVIRYIEALKKASQTELFCNTLKTIFPETAIASFDTS